MSFFPWSKRRKKGPSRPGASSDPMPSAEPGSTPGVTLQPRPKAAADRPDEFKRLLSYQVANLQGLGTCETQEDAFAFANVLDVTLIREKGLLAVVADGMGGMKGGRAASEAVVSCIRQKFGGFDYRADIAAQLYESMLQANEKVFSLLSGEGGSTVVVCIIYQEHLYFASVGDSYLYLKRNGQLLRLNRPQNVLHDLYLRLIHNGIMNPEAAELYPEKEALSQFLGMDELEDVDLLLRPLPLMDGDILLLCSDGVAGVLTEEQMANSLTGPAPKDMCGSLEQMVMQASAGQYQDNYTALIIQCGY